MDPDLLNFMLKTKGGKGPKKFSHFWDRVSVRGSKIYFLCYCLLQL
jgi:hypothetical protein